MEVLFPPFLRVIDPGVADPLRRLLVVHRHRQPEEPFRRFNFISISPIPFSILEIVVKNKQIHLTDEIEISTPWDII